MATPKPVELPGAQRMSDAEMKARMITTWAHKCPPFARLISLSQSRNWEDRFYAALQAGRSNHGGASQLLKKLFKDNNPDVSEAAMLATGLLCEYRKIALQNQVWKLHCTEPGQTVLQKEMERELEDGGVTLRYLQLALNSQNPETRRSAFCSALNCAQIGTARLFYDAMLGEKDPQTQFVAANMFAAIKDTTSAISELSPREITYASLLRERANRLFETRQLEAYLNTILDKPTIQIIEELKTGKKTVFATTNEDGAKRTWLLREKTQPTAEPPMG